MMTFGQFIGKKRMPSSLSSIVLVVGITVVVVVAENHESETTGREEKEKKEKLAKNCTQEEENNNLLGTSVHTARASYRREWNKKKARTTNGLRLSSHKSNSKSCKILVYRMTK